MTNFKCLKNYTKTNEKGDTVQEEQMMVVMTQEIDC